MKGGGGNNPDRKSHGSIDSVTVNTRSDTDYNEFCNLELPVVATERDTTLLINETEAQIITN